jgi:formylglycine-generating enzyme required for sulfatase activity
MTQPTPAAPRHEDRPSIASTLNEPPTGQDASLLGSPATEHERENRELQHEVTISRPFYLGAHEVTQREYEKVLGGDKHWRNSIFTKDRGGGPDHPRENVLFHEVLRFLQKLSERGEEKRAGRTYRLPTEAEWEYTCRAGTTTAFHYGSSLSSRQASFNGNDPYGGADKGPICA